MKQTVNIFRISQTFEKGVADCTIEESKTAYYVTIHPVGWSLPIVRDCRIKKTRIIANPMAALMASYIDLKKTPIGTEDWKVSGTTSIRTV